MNRTDAPALAELLDERRHLLDVAGRMLGSGSESERVLDATYREWYGLSDDARQAIVAPRAWLAGVADRICRERLARPAGRPAAQDAGSAARDRPELGALGDRIGGPPREQRPRSAAPEHDAVVRAVGLACVTQDAELLASVLASDVTAYFDGGGRIRALPGPVHGGEPVAHSLLTLVGRRGRTTLTAQSVNGRTGLVARCGHLVAAVISVEIAHGSATSIWVTLNPDKLRAWNRSPPHA